MNESVFAWMNVKATNIFTRKKEEKKEEVKVIYTPRGKNIFSSNYTSSSKKALWKFIGCPTVIWGERERNPSRFVETRGEKIEGEKAPPLRQVKMQMTMAAPRIIPYFSIKRHLFLFVSARDTGRVIPPRAKSVPSIRDHLALLPLLPRERRKEGEEEEDDRSRPPRWWKRCDNRKLASIKFFVSFEIGGGTNLAAKHKEPSLSLSILCFLVSLYSLSVSLCSLLGEWGGLWSSRARHM